MAFICSLVLTLSELDVKTENDQDGNKSALELLVQGTLEKIGMEYQIDATLNDVTERMDGLEPGITEIDEAFDSIAKQVDAMRDALYKPFRPEIKSLQQIEIIDTGRHSQLLAQHNHVQALQDLPPIGELHRTPLSNNQEVILLWSSHENLQSDMA